MAEPKDNPWVLCACGCGKGFPLYGKDGHPHRYYPGHKPPSARLSNKILAALEDGPKNLRQLIDLGIERRVVKIICWKLIRSGHIKRVGRTLYGRADQNSVG